MALGQRRAELLVQQWALGWAVLVVELDGVRLGRAPWLGTQPGPPRAELLVGALLPQVAI